MKEHEHYNRPSKRNFDRDGYRYESEEFSNDFESDNDDYDNRYGQRRSNSYAERDFYPPRKSSRFQGSQDGMQNNEGNKEYRRMGEGVSQDGQGRSYSQSPSYFPPYYQSAQRSAHSEGNNRQEFYGSESRNYLRPEMNQPDYDRGRAGYGGSYGSNDLDYRTGGLYGTGEYSGHQYGRTQQRDSEYPGGQEWRGDLRSNENRSGNYGQGISSYGRFHGVGPKGYKKSRQRIEEEVNEALTRHAEIDASEIEVEVNEEGQVVLKGTVESRSIKRLAEDVVESCAGVQNVRNELKIQSAENTSRQTNASSSGSSSTKSGSSKSSQSSH